MAISSNAAKIAARYKLRIVSLKKAQKKALTRVAHRVNREQQRNLSGSNKANPGSYPVPNRTGNLFRGAGVDMSGQHMAIIYNSAEYAGAVHGGGMATNQGVAYAVKPRPYLTAAAETVEPTKRLAIEYSKAILQ